MKQEEVVEVHEKYTTTSKDIPSSFRSPKIVIPWLYTIGVLWFMEKNPYYYGLRTPVYITKHYIFPFTCWYISLFALITIIPFIVLRILGTPYDTYPTPKINKKKSIFVTLIINAIFNYSMSSHVSYCMDIAYYLHFRYITFEFAKSNMQNLTAITFLFALIFSRKFWIEYVTICYRGHQDTIAMWKFSILQIKQGGAIQV